MVPDNAVVLFITLSTGGKVRCITALSPETVEV